MSDAIAEAALRKSGIISFRFEQGNPEYRIQSVYKAQQATEGGICAALCCYWIADHANEDSLWAQLYAIRSGNGGSTRLGINMSYALRIVELQRRLRTRLTNTRDFLSACGMDPHASIDSLMVNHVLDPGGGKSAMTDKRGVVPMPTGGADLLRLAYRLFEIATNEAYLLIKFGKDNWLEAGHACAAWVSRINASTVILYFDPNYGEFYFENEDSFENWLPSYLILSRYMMRYAKVTIEEFGKRYRP